MFPYPPTSVAVIVVLWKLCFDIIVKPPTIVAVVDIYNIGL